MGASYAFVLEGAAPPGCPRRGEWREHLETEDAAPAKIACAVRPVIARGFSDLDFRGPRSLQGPPFSFLSLCAVYPATLRLAASPLYLVVLRSPSIFVLLASDLPSVSLVRARIAALRRDILSVLFWRTSGGWHADKGNLLAQEILSQEARGWLAHAVRLIYLLLVSDVECL